MLIFEQFSKEFVEAYLWLASCWTTRECCTDRRPREWTILSCYLLLNLLNRTKLLIQIDRNRPNQNSFPFKYSVFAIRKKKPIIECYPCRYRSICRPGAGRRTGSLGRDGPRRPEVYIIFMTFFAAFREKYNITENWSCILCFILRFFLQIFIADLHSRTVGSNITLIGYTEQRKVRAPLLAQIVSDLSPFLTREKEIVIGGRKGLDDRLGDLGRYGDWEYPFLLSEYLDVLDVFVFCYCEKKEI